MDVEIAKNELRQQAYQFILERLNAVPVDSANADWSFSVPLEDLRLLKEGVADPSPELVASLRWLLKDTIPAGEIDSHLVSPFMEKFSSGRQEAHPMGRRNDIKKVMIIGSGPIVIGQACEFDYSGTQACKALRSLGYKIVLVNSNPATIMTDPGMADATYIEPLNLESMIRIIEKERPDAILPNLGGQTGLNLSSGFGGIGSTGEI